MFIVFPAAEYCAPVWSRSPHVKKVDVAINSSLQTIIWLSQADTCVSAPCLTRDSPCRPKAESSHPRLGTESNETRLEHPARHDKVPPCRLKSRKPYNKEAQAMPSVIPEDRSKDAWIAARGSRSGNCIRTHPSTSPRDPEEGVKGEDLSRKHWSTLNRLRTGVGRYRASMKKWGLADSAACKCGELEQTADHIINSCPLHRPPSEGGIFELGPSRTYSKNSTTIYNSLFAGYIYTYTSHSYN